MLTAHVHGADAILHLDIPYTSFSLRTGNLRLARKVAPKGERENELSFIIAAQSILAPYALIWPALLKQPAGEILSPRGQPNLF